ncbi:endo alpha-1,4 polygalactosaminidase [Nautilia sp.]
MYRVLLILFFLLFYGCGGGSYTSSQSVSDVNAGGGEDDGYILHKNIKVTYFYVGEKGSKANEYIPNISSAWDGIWMWDFGGADDPFDRNASNIYFPAKFIPFENPFYFALPYNDLEENGSVKASQKLIPWYEKETNTTILKNRWIQIIKTYPDGSVKTAYAQWEDVGPFEENDFNYVFGYASPLNPVNGAGLDVSPAVKEYLRLGDVDYVDWKFVDEDEVPQGPWKEIITTSQAHWPYFPYIDVNTTWYWQLQGDLKTDIPAKIYDVDLFDTPADTIEKLKKEGKIVICYISVGTWEDYRSDAGEFPEDVKGNDVEGWNGEKWLDIRSSTVRSIMTKRMDLAVEKGCEGIEPDNMDGYQNSTGFALTYQDQFDYNRFIAIQAKKRGLLVGLKNDTDQINDLVDYFDFAVNESCHEYGECDKLAPFVNENKPVFNAEYNKTYVENNSSFESLCEDAKKRGLRTIVVPSDLNGSFVRSCDYGDY